MQLPDHRRWWGRMWCAEQCRWHSKVEVVEGARWEYTQVVKWRAM